MMRGTLEVRKLHRHVRSVVIIACITNNTNLVAIRHTLKVDGSNTVVIDIGTIEVWYIKRVR